MRGDAPRAAPAPRPLRLKSARPLRTRMIVLMAALVLPVVALSILMMLRLATAERASAQQQNLGILHAISSAIDQQMLNARAIVSALAGAPALRRGDLAAFYALCVGVAKQYDANLLLIDPSGKEIVNVRRPFGMALPQVSSPEGSRAVLAIGTPQYSNLVYVPRNHRYRVVVYAPVVKDGTIVYVLAMSFSPESLSAVIALQHFPEEWVVTLVDRDGRIIARSRDLAAYLGRYLAGDLPTAAGTRGDATWRSTSAGYYVATRSKLTGWSVALDIPRSGGDALLRRSLIETGLGGFLLILLLVSTALFAVNRVAASMKALRAAALALGRGEVLPVVDSRISEMRDIVGAMETAADALRRRAGERDKAEEQLRASERRLTRAHRIAALGSWELDLRSGNFLWSPECYAIHGLLGAAFRPTVTTVGDLVCEEDRPAFRAWLAQLGGGTRLAGCEVRLRLAAGETRHLSYEAEPPAEDASGTARVAGTSQDITAMRRVQQQRQDLERQLHHSQKLEALGTLAGGNAHDLHNTLVPVLALSKIEMKRAASDATRRNLEMVYHAALRARDLVRQILAFSRKDRYRRELFYPAPLLREAMALLRASVPATIRLEAAIAETPPIVGDRTQLHQVVANLVANAAYAVGEHPGTIAVALGTDAGGPPGTQRLKLTVSDSGCGMDEGTKRRIFDPFFTTKPVGEGTGLGLSVVHGIVTNHGGDIRVESRPGGGTTFTIFFPQAASERDATPAVA